MSDRSYGAQTLAGSVMAVLATVGWIVALGGVGKLDDECDDETDDLCSNQFRPHWWTLSYELIVLLVLAGLALKKAVGKARLVLLVFLGLVAVRTNDAADAFITLSDSLEDDEQDAAEAASAGFVILTMVNFSLIVVVGLESMWEGWTLKFGATKKPGDGATPPAPAGAKPPPGVVMGSTQPPGNAPLAVEV